jgi:hypothetical protein
LKQERRNGKFVGVVMVKILILGSHVHVYLIMKFLNVLKKKEKK